MLSRVAESLLWMSRYVERAENVARFVDVNLNLMLEVTSTEQQWLPLVATTGDHELFERKYGQPTKDSVIRFLTLDEENPNSILSCLRAARENARSTREITSSEMWEQLNTFYLFVAETAARADNIADLHSFFARIKDGSHTFCGITDATMTHGEAWHFMRMGRMIERADKTSRILDVKYFILLRSAHEVGSPIDEIQWAAVLCSASAFEMYRKRHGRISPQHIVQFLMLDDEFPRAFRFCLNAARDSLRAISKTPPGQPGSDPERLLGQLCSELASISAEAIIADGIHEFIDELQESLNSVGEGIHETFLARRTPGSPLLQEASMRDARQQ
ncbi:MAG: alpha-E domain-containing protein [Verrucomicrobiae bacterium]